MKANDMGLLPEELSGLGGMIDLGNYIMDTAVPKYRNKDYNQKLEQIGKFLYDNREKILKGENPIPNKKSN